MLESLRSSDALAAADGDAYLEEEDCVLRDWVLGWVSV